MINSDKNLTLLLEVQQCKPLSLHENSPHIHFDVECGSVLIVIRIQELENCALISALIQISLSHTFLIDNHVRLHSSQNASYTGDVILCDLHLRVTAKPHIYVICGTFHTEVNTHLPLCSTHNLLIKR